MVLSELFLDNDFFGGSSGLFLEGMEIDRNRTNVYIQWCVTFYLRLR